MYMRGYIDRYSGSGKSGEWNWLLQRVSGVALLILLLGHFFIEHFAGIQVDYQSVAARLASTGWKLFDLTFVVFALYHGINGIFMVIEDYVHSGWRVFWKGFFWIVGVLYLVLAAITVLPFKG
jgi:succinate dehydrogenase / fumarate reductase membrane anchor subunit